MEWIVTECMVAAGCQLEVSAALIGEDVLLCLQGGERPHLGCVVQTEPRVSLSGDGSVRFRRRRSGRCRRVLDV